MPKAVLASATVALLGCVVALAVATARLAVSLRAFFSANGELRTPTGPRRYLLHLPPGLDPARPGRIRITGHREDLRTVYEVEDNGIGIAKAHQEKIFEVFHRLLQVCLAFRHLKKQTHKTFRICLGLTF